MVSPYILMALLLAYGAMAADSMYKCEDGPFNCTDEVAYICGTDGKTYLNHCKFFTEYCANNAINFAKEGKCSDENTPGAAKTSAPAKGADYNAVPSPVPTSGYVNATSSSYGNSTSKDAAMKKNGSGSATSMIHVAVLILTIVAAITL